MVFDGDGNQPIQVLSNVGVTQMENLGAWVQDHFRDDASWDDDGPLVTGTSGLVDKYLPTRFRIESSASELNAMSAQAFLDGIFPKETVPVFMQSKRNDITIATAEQCPAFAHGLNVLYEVKSAEWTEMEKSNMDLLVELAAMPVLSAYSMPHPDLNFNERYIPLRDVHRVYDMIREAKITCNKGYDTLDPASCKNLPFPHAAALLVDAEWKALQKLVKFVEVETKYGNEKAVPLLAGNLLRQITDRMVADKYSTPSDLSTKRVYITSADYPLMIALMKAIKAEPNVHLEEAVYPSRGSAFVFELYQDDETLKHVVRVLYKAAENSAPTIVYLGDRCYGKPTCNMSTFASQVHQVALSTDDWCEACGNDTSDLCLFYNSIAYQQQLKEEQDETLVLESNIAHDSEVPDNTVVFHIAEKSSDDSTRPAEDRFLAAFLGGIAVGVVLICLLGLVMRCLRSQCQERTISTPRVYKPSPTTPRTVCSSPLGVWKKTWTNSPTSDECLSVTEEDEDRSILSVDQPASPQKRRHSTIPSRQVFPPGIV